MQKESYAPLPDRPAIIRWYVNLIENLALSWHWGQEGKWDDVERVLQHTVALLYEGSRQPNGCPWPRCPDGVCSPICMIGTREDSDTRSFLDAAVQDCPGIVNESHD